MYGPPLGLAGPSMIQQIFATIAPVVIIAGIGYVWARRSLPFDNATITALVTYVGTPCLLLSSFLTRHPEPAILMQMFAAGALLIAVMGVVGFALLRALKLPMRVYLPSLMFPNTGNMGIPLSMFAFGEAGLAAAVAFFATVTLFHFSLGMSISAGRLNAKSVVASPLFWSLPIAFAMVRFGVALPAWADNTISVVGAMVIPLMLISLGVSLARFKIVALWRTFGLSAFRIGAGFLIALGICHVLDLHGPARGAVLIQASMPTAVFNYLFAVTYDNAPEEVAAIVVCSTLVSLLTLPLLLAFALN